MPKDKSLQKVTIRLHQGDKDIIDEFYPSLGHNQVIRKIVRNFCKQLQEKMNERRSPDDIEIPIE